MEIPLYLNYFPLLAVGAILGIGLAWLFYTIRHRRESVEDHLDFSQDSISATKTLLKIYELRYRNSAFRWKFSYRMLLVLSAVFSTSAAIVPKLTFFRWQASTDWAAILAGCAAIITTLVAALDFEVNWRINRKSRHAVNVLRLEANKATAQPDALISELQKIVSTRNEDLNKHD